MSNEILDGHRPQEPLPSLKLTEEQIFYPDHFTLTPYGSDIQSLYAHIDALRDPEASYSRCAQIAYDADRMCVELGMTLDEANKLRPQFDRIVQERINDLSDIGTGPARTLTFRAQQKLKSITSGLRHLSSLRIYIAVDKKR